MARSSKPIDVSTTHFSKEQIATRKEAEEKLKGSDNLIYKIPKNLSKEERIVYKFLITELQPSGILCNLDVNILEQTVIAIVKMEECKQFIDLHGIVIIKDSGDMVKNPACTAYKEYYAVFTKGLMELGLSPQSRARLAVINVNAKSDGDDELLKILKGDTNG